jgi:hypothetical protein
MVQARSATWCEEVHDFLNWKSFKRSKRVWFTTEGAENDIMASACFTLYAAK